MYTYLLIFHSLFRWLVLGSLLVALCVAFTGYSKQRSFSKSDDLIRHWTATIAHIQMVIGVIVYVKSPIVQYFWQHPGEVTSNINAFFFGIFHILLMLISVILVTIGSALAKRKQLDTVKFKTILIWFGIGLLMILIAIPWPFSPLSQRPYFRTF